MFECAYCGNPMHEAEGSVTDSHEPICPECSGVEFQGPPTDLEFGTTARYVRRAGVWYLEGRDCEGRSFSIGRIRAPQDPESQPERLWLEPEPKCAWDVDFIDLDGPFRSRKIRGTTPQRCVYCKEISELEPGGGQCESEPSCSRCYEGVDAASPGIRLRGLEFRYVCRRGRWFLEGVDHRTGADFVEGELARPPATPAEAPRSRQDESGRWIWDCEFKDGQQRYACDQWGTPYCCASEPTPSNDTDINGEQQ